LEQLSLLLAERRNLCPAELNRPDRYALAQQRHAERCPVTQFLGEGAPIRKFLRLSLKVEHVDRPALENGAAVNSAAHAGHANSDRLRNRAPVSGRLQLLPFELENGDIIGAAETCGAADHGVEHGLEIGRGATDDLQDFGIRGLPFQSLGSLPLCLGKLPLRLVNVAPRLIKLAGPRFDLLP